MRHGFKFAMSVGHNQTVNVSTDARTPSSSLIIAQGDVVTCPVSRKVWYRIENSLELLVDHNINENDWTWDSNSGPVAVLRHYRRVHKMSPLISDLDENQQTQRHSAGWNL